uniref:Homeobox domain-containing protein n=1 Tax=Ananas comosus var. bracteatus TaxID=296719 RepID=A0A6V7PEF5_ANACO|nr:unnamed protein product [Ananas comosus var. bracteatus]
MMRTPPPKTLAMMGPPGPPRGAGPDPVDAEARADPHTRVHLQQRDGEPPKDETVRIRKLLEKFGAVGDANVFYWFQNRRSRSRRRQRQMQAGLLNDPVAGSGSSSSSSSSSRSLSSGGFLASSSSSSSSSSSNSCSSSSFIGDDCSSSDDLFAISRQMGFVESNRFAPAFVGASSDVTSQLHYQAAGTITVFINGIASEVPRGPIDLRAMFGQGVMLVHSSGDLLPVNEYGILMHSLQMGESYFLVPRPT